MAVTKKGRTYMITGTQDETVDRLPPELSGRLQAMINRVRRIIWIRGLLTSAAVLFGCSLVIMAIDAGVMIISPGVRWALSITALACVLATGWNALLRPLLRPLSLTRMARVLETRHPELQERISSAIELLSMGGTAGATGSEQLIQLLARDAETDMRGVQARREFTGRSLKPALVSASVIGGVFALLFVAWPHQTSLLFARAVAPYANLSDLQGAGLSVEPGDALRLEGSDLVIRLRVEGRAPARAEVHTESGAGNTLVERMLAVSAEGEEPAVYELTFPSVTGSFRYRVRYGTGLTRYHQVTVLPLPAFTRLVITTRYPAYTQRPDFIVPDDGRDIRGLLGGQVTVEAEFNRAAEGTLLLGSQQLPGVMGETPGATWTIPLSANMTNRWAVALRDEHGFTNRVEWASFNVVADRAPTVQLDLPKAPKLLLPPYGPLAFNGRINEDFGLATAELVLQSLDANKVEELQILNLTKAGAEEWSCETALDLGLLELTRFKAFLRVTDTLPSELGGPQQGFSREVEITIKADALGLAAQERMKIKEDLVKLLKESAGLLTKAADQVASVKARTAVDPLPAPIASTLAAARDAANGGGMKLGQAHALCAGSRFAPLAEPIRLVVHDHVKPAWQSTVKIPEVEAALRPAQGDTATQELRVSVEQVLALIKAAEELNALLARQDEEAARLHALARDQALLADEAGDKLTPEEMEEWLKKQQALKDALQAMKTAAKKSKVEKNMDDAKKFMKMAKAQKMKKPLGEKKNEDPTESQNNKGKGGKKGKTAPPDGEIPEDKPPAPANPPPGLKSTQEEKAETTDMMPPDAPPADVPPMDAEDAAEAAAKALTDMALKAQSLPSTSAPKVGKGYVAGKGKMKPGSAFVYTPGNFENDIMDNDWAKIKGQSDAGASVDNMKTVSPEYRGLVHRYFVELAREAAKKE
jgi:hypothetical protein